MNIKNYLLNEKSSLKNLLKKLNKLGKEGVVFIVNDEDKLIGSISDGDIRRGLIENSKSRDISSIMNKNPQFLESKDLCYLKFKEIKDSGIKLIPITNNKVVIDIISLINYKSFLPIDVVIMAGGKGTRLRPLTLTCPKPLLQVNNKPIIDYVFEDLLSYRVTNFSFTLNYMPEKIIKHFDEKELNKIKINYAIEEEPLGTLGGVSLIKNKFENDVVLVTNSDLLCDLDYEDFYEKFIKSGADLGVVSVPYKVQIPYAVFELNESIVKSLKEKPTKTFYCNAGIYLIRTKILNNIEENKFYNATDLIEELLLDKGKVFTYNLMNYWLDIGKPDDFEKAQIDIKNLNL